ncbi:regulator of nonsense transcripts UPF3-like isoform X1 [Olea europaea var. sylvestris]|uniref:regulator of nonsense transcripts UPF3-like isoform X1 n=1 Tax=Olea europaea var. sylvestris TaxID=158386 RepID=UPI000C1D16BD|nr:regulator of nonsense transcripts UPF3-like isoform X1 [Olea europaea var. sylvestris]XP_022861744.1 regulator of nonsense transcripts UPF3-like isoform X1 [Olea europaea var. sylvestris]XP_022861751.1 regulator of nonsense transcripts UPF3-like isoform X1 [Olea europaea var. sylvestris]XP_022861756.1 regulator of nonsense transcripts UPF3-like isoform X1 [Olea europaea var. sylvestris]
MKGMLDRTKVVVRHLPPTISRSALIEHVDSGFRGRYRWLSFRQGRSSLKHPSYSRAYIDFNQPENTIEFAEFFNGHVFVNEKGTQFKTLVEYAPSQRVPKQLSNRDGREGTIFKDPEYLEFLEFLAKPIENLPSAEIQLERREAERAVLHFILGAPKDIPIVTPLMDYVRQKRAAKIGRRVLLNGKPARRVTGVLSKSSGSGSSKRGSEKWTSTTMYVLRDSSKSAIGKDKSTNKLVPKRDDQQLSKMSVSSAAASGTADALDKESEGSRPNVTGKKKILLLKGKEKEIPINQRLETSGRIIRSILLNRDSRQNQSEYVPQSELQTHTPDQDRDKRPPRPPSLHRKDSSGASGDKVFGNDLQGIHSEKLERRTRNKDRPDHGVQTPVQCSNGSRSSDRSLTSFTSQTFQVKDSTEDFLGTHADIKHDMLVARGSELRYTGSGRGSHYSVDVVSYRCRGRRGSLHDVKDAGGSSLVESKPLKRVSSVHGSHEKQVWVQKSCSGS